ncbi:MAG: TetR/AcrR family transcriptional regulator [Solirubrobacteraceae bacterium]
MLDALAEIVAAHGLRRTTITAVTAQASVSQATFSEVFGSVEQAFTSLVRQVSIQAVLGVCEAFDRESSWPLGVLAGVESLLGFLDAEPALARVWLVEAFAGPPEALVQRVELLAPLVVRIDAVREAIPTSRQPPAFAAEAVVASMLGVLHGRLVTNRAAPFIGMLAELVTVPVMPFLGRAQADEIARLGELRYQAIAEERAARPLSARTPVPKLLRHASARRARACLLYVVRHLGASNQDVALGVGVTHHGQISTLLARLERLGMLIKIAGGAGRTNAWSLSSQGQELVAWIGLR